MPRSGSGVFTLVGAVNPVVANTDITATWANSTLDDIAQALTDSLSRNGDGGMNVPLQFANGSVGAPGITWDNDLTSGFYLQAAGDMRLSIQNQNTLRFYNNGGTREVYVWASAAWRQLIDETSTSLCDPTGASAGDVPVWSGSAWVPGASGSTIPAGSADNDIILWNNTLGVYQSGPIPQQIANGTTAGRPLGWNGSAWVERAGATIGLNAGDGATVAGDLTVSDDLTATNLFASGIVASAALLTNLTVSSVIDANGAAGRVQASGAAGDVTARSGAYSLVTTQDDLNSPTGPSVRTTGSAWATGLATTDVQTAPTLNRATATCVCTEAQYAQEVIDGVVADTLYFVE